MRNPPRFARARSDQHQAGAVHEVGGTMLGWIEAVEDIRILRAKRGMSPTHGSTMQCSSQANKNIIQIGVKASSKPIMR